jgi:hypothetical protein
MPPSSRNGYEALRAELAAIRADLIMLRRRVDDMQHRLTLLTWMIGILMGVVLAQLLLLLAGLWRLR